MSILESRYVRTRLAIYSGPLNTKPNSPDRSRPGSRERSPFLSRASRLRPLVDYRFGRLPRGDDQRTLSGRCRWSRAGALRIHNSSLRGVSAHYGGGLGDHSRGPCTRPREVRLPLLRSVGSPLLDRKSDLVKDAEAAIDLRNRLIHFRPEDRSAEDEAHAMERIRGKFADKPSWLALGTRGGRTRRSVTEPRIGRIARSSLLPITFRMRWGSCRTTGGWRPPDENRRLECERADGGGPASDDGLAVRRGLPARANAPGWIARARGDDRTSRLGALLEVGGHLSHLLERIDGPKRPPLLGVTDRVLRVSHPRVN